MNSQQQRTERREEGTAIIIALVFVVIAVGLVTSGTLMMKASTDTADVRFRRENQATQFARSGLTEALSWFRRQTAQPVTDFAPQLDLSADPQINDTDDSIVGLVRQFEISDGIWGRYEVWRKNESDPDPTRLAFRRQYEVSDLSVERGFAGAGNVWLIRCVGYVYLRRSSTAAFDEKPNRVLAMATVEGEVQRLTLQPPGQAAISVSMGSLATINTNGRVRGGATGAGIFYPSGPSPTTGPSWQNRVTGSPALSATGSYDDSVKSVFGVSSSELRSMADLVITDESDFPDPIPSNSIVYLDVASITFDATRSLNGSGIVFIDGNVSLISGNKSSFNGLLYVDGNLSMRQTSDIYGALVVTGSLTVQGSGDYSTIWYDDDVLNQLRTIVGQYRWSGAFRPIRNQE